MKEYIDGEGNKYRAQNTAHGWRIGIRPIETGEWKKYAKAPYYMDRVKAEELLDDIAAIKGWTEVGR